MFTKLLVPLDGSSLAERVLPHTIAMAHLFDARVTLLRVMPTSHINAPQVNAPHPGAHHPGTPFDVMDWRLLEMEAEAYLNRIAAHLDAAGIRVETSVTQGDPAHGIIDAIDKQSIDLVILSSHGESGLTGWNIGSVVQKVLLHTPTSSLLVRAYHPIEPQESDLHYRRLLVPLDGSLRAECVVPLATKMARFFDADLLLAHIVSHPEAPRQRPLSGEDRALITELVARNRAATTAHLKELVAQLPVEAHLRIVENHDVATALHGVVEDAGADLVIMSAHGYSGRSHWPYGRVASNYIVYGEAPLLLVQDLAATERSPTAAECAAQEAGGHRFMPQERFLTCMA